MTDAKDVGVFLQSLRDDLDSLAAKLKDHMQAKPKKKKKKTTEDEDDE